MSLFDCTLIRFAFVRSTFLSSRHVLNAAVALPQRQLELRKFCFFLFLVIGESDGPLREQRPVVSL